jgi:zinc finger protein
MLQGMTKLLLTKIPYFREIVIMSFQCEHCGFHNSEIQSAGEIQQKGVKFDFRVDNDSDLSRQIIKSDTCVFRIEDIDLEVPAGRGQMTNIEGILSTIAQDLEEKQPERLQVDEELHAKLAAIITLVKNMAEGLQVPLAISLNDPAGNSWVEPSPSDPSGKLLRSEYRRTPEQNTALGLSADTDNGELLSDPVDMRPEYHPQQMFPARAEGPNTNNVDDDDIIENEVYNFPDSCPGCMKNAETKMKMVNIPHFKKVVIMNTSCDHCGYKSNEVKSGGEIPEKGRCITILVNKIEDLSRDILKSEFCAMECSELKLSIQPGTLGGRFTTIEGILVNVRDDLKANVFDADGGGDGMVSNDKEKWEAFFDRIDEAISGHFFPFTLVLKDPIASSYVQSLAEVDGELDDRLKIEDYERTEEEKEDLGLNDMRTENYEEEPHHTT